ncbi:MAG: hypothetical protein Q7U60_08300, partial [Candidatus Methanoperedens sp.]|nr:hypothetical protein [Candidatus Methanoperedens sp.]
HTPSFDKTFSKFYADTHGLRIRVNPSNPCKSVFYVGRRTPQRAQRAQSEGSRRHQEKNLRSSAFICGL